MAWSTRRASYSWLCFCSLFSVASMLARALKLSDLVYNGESSTSVSVITIFWFSDFKW